MREDTNVRIIKRYQNRKLYDTFQSCYVTLEEISQIIRDGHEIKVVDNKTKNDITYITQIQLLFDMERKHSSIRDCDLLKRVIRSSTGTFTGYISDLELSFGTRQAARPSTVATHPKNYNANMSSFEQDSLETPASLN